MKKRIKEKLVHVVKSVLEDTGISVRRVNRALDFINGDFYFRKSVDRIGSVDKAGQIQLLMAYQDRARTNLPLPTFRDAEFRCFSQNGEDGILLLLFAVVGMTNRKCVEMCAGDGMTCNSANLIINHGFDALQVDGVKGNIDRGTKYYETLKDTRLWPPKLVNAWITRENVNSLCAENGMEGEIDLFSLDMDGVDY